MTEKTRVLLVEDNPGDARLIAETIADVPGGPFALVTVPTLAEAIRRRDQHDVVLLDLSLPDGHGLETVTRMIAAPTSTPVVVLTGTHDDELASRAVQAGAQDYLVKGEVTPELLGRTLRYAIERRKAEEDALVAREARRARFLFEVGSELSVSLDVHEMGRRLAELLVPTLADCCVLEVATNDGTLERVGCAATDPTFERLVADSVNASAASVYEGARASLVLPLRVGERSVGALTLMRLQRTSAFGDDDRLLADQIAMRAALAVENARLYRDAQRALRARDEMLAVVSHDLRNPLSVIGLSLRMLAPAVRADQPRAATLLRAQNAFERMHRLVEDLLDLARIDQGNLRVDRKRQPLGHLLAEHIEAQRPIAEDRGIALELAAPPDVVVDVDRDRIGQVLANLVGNALKFTPRGGSVRVRTHCTNRTARIEVEDSGVGISPEVLPRVFDRFFQSARAEAKQGVGLGLAIAKGIVEAHGGSIDVVSPPGAGATFGVSLPVAAADEPDMTAPA